MTLSDPRGWLPALVRWGFSPSDGTGPDLDARKWLKRVREANPQDITGWGRDLADRRARFWVNLNSRSYAEKHKLRVDKREKKTKRRSPLFQRGQTHQLIFLFGEQRDRHPPAKLSSAEATKQCFQRYQRLIKTYHTQAVLYFLYKPGMIPTITTYYYCC